MSAAFAQSVFYSLFPFPYSLLPCSKSHSSNIPPFLVCNPMKPINMTFFLFASGSAFFTKSSANTHNSKQFSTAAATELLASSCKLLSTCRYLNPASQTGRLMT
jgi:hypothetical protein